MNYLVFISRRVIKLKILIFMRRWETQGVASEIAWRTSHLILGDSLSHNGQ